MFLDNNLVFSDGQSLITTTATRSSYIIDLATGTNFLSTATTYVTNPNLNWGPNATAFGEDLGIGDASSPPNVIVLVSTTFTTTNSCTLQVAFQGAVDDASGTVSGLTWTTYIETDTIAASLLTAGAKAAVFTIPHRKLAATPAFPRFISLNYVTDHSFTAGALKSFIDLQNFNWPTYPSGFKPPA